jgi:hypothetical protein
MRKEKIKNKLHSLNLKKELNPITSLTTTKKICGNGLTSSEIFIKLG